MQYPINKGVNEPINFAGLVGSRYAIWLVAGLGSLFILCTLFVMAGANPVGVLLFVILAAVGWTTHVFRLSSKYGEHGAMKQQTKQRLPKRIVNRNPRLFQHLKA